jgi:hypothetical protein
MIRYRVLLSALLLLPPSLVPAADDAAIKAQEGEINHWIEYYRNERAKAAAKPPPTPAPDASAAQPATADVPKQDKPAAR